MSASFRILAGLMLFCRCVTDATAGASDAENSAGTRSRIGREQAAESSSRDTASRPLAERPVVILAGQSNAVGFDARPSELPAFDLPHSSGGTEKRPDSHVRFWFRTGDPPPDQFDSTSGERWIRLGVQPRGNPQDSRDAAGMPVPRQYGNFAQSEGGFGPEIGFVRTLIHQGHSPPDIIKTAFSGTSLDSDWAPNRTDEGSCFRALKETWETARAAAESDGFRLKPAGLIWVQGESDAVPDRAARYADNLTEFIAAVRKHLRSPHLPVILSVNTRFGNGANPQMQTVIRAQKKVASADPMTRYTDTSGAETLGPSHTHFTAAGTLEIGRRVAHDWHHLAAVSTDTPDPDSVVSSAEESNTEQVPELPNVILLMGDDHGWDETGYNGHPYLKTPHLDAMASAGLQLNRFHSAAPNCSPTRGSVLTGRHPNRYGTFNPGYSIRPEEHTLAQILAGAGYRCGHFGKWHLGAVRHDSPVNPGGMGFDTWLSHDNFFELDPILSRDGADPVKIPGESSQVIVSAATEFIKEAEENAQPFLAVIWFGSPHEPYSGLPADLALYDDLPESLGNRNVRLTSNETGSPVSRRQRDVLQERFAEITAMDRSIGNLRSFLRSRDLHDNTIVWYCGDNGTSAESAVTVPFRGAKGSIYDGGVRVPGLIEWPAVISAPIESDVPAVTSDILPTLCEIVGAELPRRPLDGISLLPLLRGEMNARGRPIGFWQWRARLPEDAEPWIDPELQKGTTPLVKLMAGKATRDFRNMTYPAVRRQDLIGPRSWLDESWKLVVDADRRKPVQLFNLQSDPSEKDDVAEQHPERVTEMKRQLDLWQQSVLRSLTGADYN